jgi:hypothetical protein
VDIVVTRVWFLGGRQVGIVVTRVWSRGGRQVDIYKSSPQETTCVSSILISDGILLCYGGNNVYDQLEED